ncbi:hypothetical protein [Arthrobacter sp. UYCu712]|uniref:hypothetical protein n=1 Tax=Arthrobacter sp. UYCu712 TaxID=3156340 RepID=UPI0033917D34
MEKYISWPWNRPWIWLVCMGAVVLVNAPVRLMRQGCGQAATAAGFDVADLPCSDAPVLGWVVTGVVGAISLLLLVRFAVGLLKAVGYSRKLAARSPRRR